MSSDIIVSGKGLTCRVGKYRVAIGNLSWMKEVGAPALSEAHAKLAKMEESLGKVRKQIEDGWRTPTEQ